MNQCLWTQINIWNDKNKKVLPWHLHISCIDSEYWPGQDLDDNGHQDFPNNCHYVKVKGQQTKITQQYIGPIQFSNNDQPKYFKTKTIFSKLKVKGLNNLRVCKFHIWLTCSNNMKQLSCVVSNYSPRQDLERWTDWWQS